jgi:hypothetical protein
LGVSNANTTDAKRRFVSVLSPWQRANLQEGGREKKSRKSVAIPKAKKWFQVLMSCYLFFAIQNFWTESGEKKTRASAEWKLRRKGSLEKGEVSEKKFKKNQEHNKPEWITVVV